MSFFPLLKLWNMLLLDYSVSMCIHVILFPLHPSCLWNHQMLLATCADLGIGSSANDLCSELPFGFTVHPLNSVLPSMTILHNTSSCCCHGCAALLFLSSDTKVETHVSALRYICIWKSAHHRNLNLNKTDSFFCLRNSCSLQDLSITSDKTLARSAKTQQTVKWRSNFSYNLNLQVWTLIDFLAIISVQPFLQALNSLHFISWNSPSLFQIVGCGNWVFPRGMNKVLLSFFPFMQFEWRGCLVSGKWQVWFKKRWEVIGNAFIQHVSSGTVGLQLIFILIIYKPIDYFSKFFKVTVAFMPKNMKNHNFPEPKVACSNSLFYLTNS